MSAPTMTLAESGALRQLKHNDGSEGFVFAYDKAITDRYIAELRAALESRQGVAVSAVGLALLANEIVVARTIGYHSVQLIMTSQDRAKEFCEAVNAFLAAPQPPAVKEAEQPSPRHDSRTAYESLDLKGRRRMDETLARVDQMIQDAKRRKHPDRRQHVAPVAVERRVADARGTGVHQDRKPD